jgi:hypothetical protein
MTSSPVAHTTRTSFRRARRSATRWVMQAPQPRQGRVDVSEDKRRNHPKCQSKRARKVQKTMALDGFLVAPKA